MPAGGADRRRLGEAPTPPEHHHADPGRADVALGAGGVDRRDRRRYRFAAWDDGARARPRRDGHQPGDPHGHVRHRRAGRLLDRQARVTRRRLDRASEPAAMATQDWFRFTRDGRHPARGRHAGRPGGRRDASSCTRLPSTLLASPTTPAPGSSGSPGASPAGTYRVRVRVPSGAASLAPYALRVLRPRTIGRRSRA